MRHPSAAEGAAQFARDLLASASTGKNKIMRGTVAAFFVLSIAAVGYAEGQCAYISARQQTVLNELVKRLAEESGETEISIWRRIAARTGASNALTIRKWYYCDALNMMADEISVQEQSRPVK